MEINHGRLKPQGIVLSETADAAKSKLAAVFGADLDRPGRSVHRGAIRRSVPAGRPAADPLGDRSEPPRLLGRLRLVHQSPASKPTDVRNPFVPHVLLPS